MVPPQPRRSRNPYDTPSHRRNRRRRQKRRGNRPIARRRRGSATRGQQSRRLHRLRPGRCPPTGRRGGRRRRTRRGPGPACRDYGIGQGPVRRRRPSDPRRHQARAARALAAGGLPRPLPPPARRGHRRQDAHGRTGLRGHRPESEHRHPDQSLGSGGTPRARRLFVRCRCEFVGRISPDRTGKRYRRIDPDPRCGHGRCRPPPHHGTVANRWRRSPLDHVRHGGIPDAHRRRYPPCLPRNRLPGAWRRSPRRPVRQPPPPAAARSPAFGSAFHVPGSGRKPNPTSPWS